MSYIPDRIKIPRGG